VNIPTGVDTGSCRTNSARPAGLRIPDLFNQTRTRTGERWSRTLHDGRCSIWTPASTAHIRITNAPANMKPECGPNVHRRWALASKQQAAPAPTSWTTAAKRDGELVPNLPRQLVGEDQKRSVHATRFGPSRQRAHRHRVGASILQRKIVCFGQHETYSYFQTRKWR